MKNTVKKIFSSAMTGISLIALTVAASAENHYTGLIEPRFDSITQMYDENNELLPLYSDFRKGDLDANGLIQSSDARICLRVAANLEDIPYRKRLACDVNEDGKINSADARLILRASAKLEKLPTDVIYDFTGNASTIMLKSGNKFFWQCICDSENISVKEYRIADASNDKVGNGVDRFFVFAAKTEGKHTVKFVYANSNQTEILEEFSVILDA